jgi:hypothetical protein
MYFRLLIVKNDINSLHNFLLSCYSKDYVEKIMKGIKNPAKFPWIPAELTHIYQTIQNKRNELNDREFLRIIEIIEDQLTYVSLICQDSKCDPLKFIDYKKK